MLVPKSVRDRCPQDISVDTRPIVLWTVHYRPFSIAEQVKDVCQPYISPRSYHDQVSLSISLRPDSMIDSIFGGFERTAAVAELLRAIVKD